MYHFTSALRFEPKKAKVAYVLHNNMGYCLNRLGRFEEAGAYCRTAIAIDSQRASAYRNLGVSLEGQGHLVSAAWAWVESIKVDGTDERARCLLKKLIASRPSIALQCPWIEEGIIPSNQRGEEKFFCCAIILLNRILAFIALFYNIEITQVEKRYRTLILGFSLSSVKLL